MLNKIKSSTRIKLIKNFWWDIIINKIAASKLTSRYVRWTIYKIFRLNVLTACIAPDCYFGSSNFSIGKGGYVNKECFFDNENGATIMIGNNCAIGYQTMILTTTHDFTKPKRRAGEAIGKKVIIEDGCWLGARVTVMPGIRIEEACVIASGAVVTKDCRKNGLYAGVPAQRIKDL